MITPEHEKARRLEAIKRHLGEGGSIASAARELGCRPGTLSEWTRSSLGVNNSRDLAVQTAMDAVGTGLVPHSMWTIVPPKDGEPGFSVYHKIEQTPEDVAERIRAALEAIPAIPVIQPPNYADDDLLTVYPLADVHLGVMAAEKEAGADYNTKIAAERVVAWIGRCIASSPKSGTAVLLDVGDLQHANDQTNETQRGKHKLHVDTRPFKTTQTAIQALATAGDQLAMHHAKVIIRILPGNHNPDAYLSIMFALGQRYRDNPRVEVQEVPGEFFAHEHGDVMICAHHGDKAKAERLVTFMADEFAPMWGRTKHRFLFTGHLHHHKSADIGGVQWEQLRAVTERDDYAVSHAYSARAQLQAITYHRTRGEVQRVKVGA
jgi:hypothetical protein